MIIMIMMKKKIQLNDGKRDECHSDVDVNVKMGDTVYP